MRARLLTLSLCLSVLLVLPSQANEKPTPEYQKAMKELGTVNNHLRNSLKDIDFAAIEKDAAAMKAIFATVLGYWQEKKVEDAIKLSQDGIKAATDLEAAAKAQNHPGVMASAHDNDADAAVARLGTALSLSRELHDEHYAAWALNTLGVVAAQAAIAGASSSGEIGAIGVCAPCHTAHRVRLPDGTYEIK